MSRIRATGSNEESISRPTSEGVSLIALHPGPCAHQLKATPNAGLELTERDTEQMADVCENPLYQATGRGNYSIAIVNSGLKPMEAGARYACWARCFQKSGVMRRRRTC
jgi:hypothetical protein